MKQFASLLAIVAVAAFASVTVAQDDASKCQCPSQQNQTIATSSQQSECPGKCAEGGSCCQEATVATSLQEKSECPGTCAAGGTCCQEAAVATSKQEGEACQECPVSAAMAALPKMSYKVGEEVTCCSASATELAEKSEAPIHFVVAENVYETKEEAFTALVSHTEEMVNTFVTPATCEASGCTTVAGKACGCEHEAAARTELVTTAINAVNMEYKVGEESACCAGSAKAMADNTGEPIQYVVAGEATPCEMTARLALAHARYKAAVQATLAEAAPAAEAPAATETGSGT